MGADLPQSLLEMIRRPPPVAEAVAGSTPVIAFGDVTQAAVATLGINPSCREFLDRSGALLSGNGRRLASLASLGAEDLTRLDTSQAALVFEECLSYFRNNPYRSWFNPLDEVVRAATGASYYDNTACHLDLVQWATDPIWGFLPRQVRLILLDEGRRHLRSLLCHCNIRLVLLNGRAVIDEVKASRLVRLDLYDRIPVSIRVPCSLYYGEWQMVRFIGWSANLQSSWGVTREFRSRLSNLLANKMAGAASPGSTDAIAEDTFDPQGYVAKGTVVCGKRALHALLQQWLDRTDVPTIGPVGKYGGTPWVTVRLDQQYVAVLNADTKRLAVQAYVDYAGRRGVEAPWRILPAQGSRRWNKLIFRADGQRTPGWYCYLKPDANGPGQV